MTLKKWSPEEAQKYYLEVITASNEPDFPRELNWFVGNAYASSCLLDTLVAFRSGQPPSPWPEIEAKCQKGLEILEPIIEDSTMPAPLTEYRAILAYIIAQQPGREADSCRVYDQVITEAAGNPICRLIGSSRLRILGVNYTVNDREKA
ncbi:MAG: hypothetical protein HC875_37600 [Anaerolineales bacterium]|nr:hypothetical protein [Anaerolineales bacterium]